LTTFPVHLQPPTTRRRPRTDPRSGSNGSAGNASSTSPQPPSAPQTPTSLHSSSTGSVSTSVSSSSAGGLGSTSSAGCFSSSYAQSGFMPVEASPTASVFSYPSSWQSNGNYWNATSVPGPMPMNVCSGRNICEYSIGG